MLAGKFVENAPQCFASAPQQTFSPIIWIFTEGEGDEIRYRLKKISALNVNFSTPNKLEILQLENFDAWFVSLDQWQPTQVQMTNIFESKQADTY